MEIVYFKIFVNYLLSFFYVKKKAEFQYPINIKGYIFKKALFTDYQHRSFKYAIYEKDRKKAFLKLWANTYKNFDYYSLIHEVKFYRLLENSINKQNRSNQTNSNIKVPKLLYIQEDKNKVTLLLEHIEGVDIKSLLTEKKIKIYQDVIKFLNNLYLNISVNSFGSFKSTKLLIINFPLLILLTAIKFPDRTGILLRSIKIYFLNIANILTTHKYTLVHRSLEDQNILIEGNNTYLIDWQLVTIAHPY